MIMEMVGSRSFTLTIGNGKRRRLRRLKNGVLAPLLFNIYISDLPNTVSRKYEYVDDLASVSADGDWQAMEGVLSKNMATLDEYLQSWKLNPKTTKRVSAVVHLNNKEVKSEFKANHNIPFNPAIAIIMAQGLQRHNSPVDWARKLFKPSTDSASLLVEIEKTFFRFGFVALWWRTSQVEVSFSFY